LTPCYYKDSTFTTELNATNYTTGSFYCDFDENGHRLPTEGEWEYCTRAGTTGPFSMEETNYTDDNCYLASTSGMFPNLETVANFWANSGEKTTAAGSKNSNPWGLKDVHGNVLEWCWDWYSSSYPSGSATDYAGSTSGSSRVKRGGSWYDYVRHCRSASRNFNSPDFRSDHIGFRLLRTYP